MDQKGSAAMLTAIQRESTQKKDPLRADVTRSPKQGYQWPNEKDLRPQNSKKKKK